MSKVNDIMQARNQGIAYALKKAKEHGIEALEEEVKYRGISGQSIVYGTAEIRENYHKMAKHATELCIAIGINVLIDEYGFTKKQAQQFKDNFDGYVKQCLANRDKQAEIITRAEMQGIELIKEF